MNRAAHYRQLVVPLPWNERSTTVSRSFDPSDESDEPMDASRRPYRRLPTSL